MTTGLFYRTSDERGPLSFSALGKRKADDAPEGEEPPAKQPELGADAEAAAPEQAAAAPAGEDYQHQFAAASEHVQQPQGHDAEQAPSHLAKPSEMSPDGLKLTIFVGPEMVGKIIGKKGETIKSIQTNSGARVDVNQNLPDGEPRQARIHLFPLTQNHSPTATNRVWLVLPPLGLRSRPSPAPHASHERSPPRAAQVTITAQHPTQVQTARIMVENLLSTAQGGAPPAGAEEKARISRPSTPFLCVPTRNRIAGPVAFPPPLALCCSLTAAKKPIRREPLR